MPNYLDLLNPDGSRNQAAFDAILASRINAEVALRLCLADGKRAPRGLSFAEARIWRSAVAAHIDPSLVPQSERDRIAEEHRLDLEEWVLAMSRAAVRQRNAMTAAAEQLIAAE